MEEDASEEQVAVEAGIEVGDAVGKRQERHNVLEKPGVIRVVVLDPRGGRGELADEFFIDQEALGERTEVGIAPCAGR